MIIKLRLYPKNIYHLRLARGPQTIPGLFRSKDLCDSLEFWLSFFIFSSMKKK